MRFHSQVPQECTRCRFLDRFLENRRSRDCIQDYQRSKSTSMGFDDKQDLCESSKFWIVKSSRLDSKCVTGQWNNYESSSAARASGRDAFVPRAVYFQSN